MSTLKSSTIWAITPRLTALSASPLLLYFENFFIRFFLETFHCNLDVEETYFLFYWKCLTCGLNRGFMSNKPTHYLANYGDFPLLQFNKTVGWLKFVVFTCRIYTDFILSNISRYCLNIFNFFFWIRYVRYKINHQTQSE